MVRAHAARNHDELFPRHRPGLHGLVAPAVVQPVDLQWLRPIEFR